VLAVVESLPSSFIALQLIAAFLNDLTPDEPLAVQLKFSSSLPSPVFQPINVSADRLLPAFEALLFSLFLPATLSSFLLT